MADTPTADPTIVIEEQREGYVRYRATSGRRWEVHGTCDRRGDCLIGANVLDGDVRVQVRDRAHLNALNRGNNRRRIDSELDVPVTPEFETCCGADIFSYVELERVNGDEVIS